MKIDWKAIGARIGKFWTDHKADEEAALTFVHKYPMQIIILVLCLCLLITCSSHKKVAPCVLSTSSVTAVSPPERAASHSQLPIFIPQVREAVYTVYEYPRPDGGSAYSVPASNVGSTLLKDGDNGKTIGEVYIDAAAQGIIIQVNKVYVGIK